MTSKPRLFELIRDVDVSGVSGTGKVAEGAVFSDGTAVVHWIGQWSTTAVHCQGIDSVREIHGHAGRTRVVWTSD